MSISYPLFSWASFLGEKLAKVAPLGPALACKHIDEERALIWKALEREFRYLESGDVLTPEVVQNARMMLMDLPENGGSQVDHRTILRILFSLAQQAQVTNELLDRHGVHDTSTKIARVWMTEVKDEDLGNWKEPGPAPLVVADFAERVLLVDRDKIRMDFLVGRMKNSVVRIARSMTGPASEQQETVVGVYSSLPKDWAKEKGGLESVDVAGHDVGINKQLLGLREDSVKIFAYDSGLYRSAPLTMALDLLRNPDTDYFTLPATFRDNIPLRK